MSIGLLLYEGTFGGVATRIDDTVFHRVTTAYSHIPVSLFFIPVSPRGANEK